MYTLPSDLTKENYFSALSRIQNNSMFRCIDIITFAGMCNWSEKVEHYTYYYNQVKEA